MGVFLNIPEMNMSFTRAATEDHFVRRMCKILRNSTLSDIYVIDLSRCSLTRALVSFYLI